MSTSNFQNPGPEAGGEHLAEVITRAKQELQRMIDVNPAAIVLLDGTGVIQRVNRAFLSLVGAAAFGSVLGRDLAPMLQTDAATLLARVGATLPDAAGFDCTLALPAGGSRLVRVHRMEVGGDTGIILLLQDVTDERETSALLEKSYKVEAVRALMGALMHHLNQPLTVVMLRARLLVQSLERGAVSVDEIKSTLEDIAGAAMRVANTLRRVESARDYSTQEYVEGLQIMTIDPDVDGRAHKQPGAPDQESSKSV